MTDDEANTVRASAAVFIIIGNAPGAVDVDYVYADTGDDVVPGAIVFGLDYLPGRFRLTVTPEP